MSTPDAPLSDFGWEYLNKITDFCQENGIQLVLFTAPLPSGYLYNTQTTKPMWMPCRIFAPRTRAWNTGISPSTACSAISI